MTDPCEKKLTPIQLAKEKVVKAAMYRYLLNLKARYQGNVTLTQKDSASTRLSEACAELDRLRVGKRVWKKK